jgi:hypothetical protein
MGQVRFPSQDHTRINGRFRFRTCYLAAKPGPFPRLLPCKVEAKARAPQRGHCITWEQVTAPPPSPGPGAAAASSRRGGGRRWRSRRPARRRSAASRTPARTVASRSAQPRGDTRWAGGRGGPQPVPRQPGSPPRTFLQPDAATWKLLEYTSPLREPWRLSTPASTDAAAMYSAMPMLPRAFTALSQSAAGFAPALHARTSGVKGYEASGLLSVGEPA